jgi:hypothetical protein
MLKMLLMLDRLLVLLLSGEESLVGVSNVGLMLSRSLVRRSLAVFGLGVSMRLLELLNMSMTSGEGGIDGLKAVGVVCAKGGCQRSIGKKERKGRRRTIVLRGNGDSMVIVLCKCWK